MTLKKILIVSGTHGNEINQIWAVNQFSKQENIIDKNISKLYALIAPPIPIKIYLSKVEKYRGNTFLTYKESTPLNCVTSESENETHLLFKLLGSGKILSIVPSKAENNRFTYDSKFVVFNIKAWKDTIVEMKRRKVKKDKMPKDTLGIFNLKDKSLIKLSHIKSYKSPEKWSGFIGNTTSQGSIKVSEVDKIHKKAVLKPFLGGNKIFVLWGSETMMPQTSNKLLKILEEPPTDTYFILITNSLQALLPTIISRCQISNLGPIDHEELKQFLKNLKIFSRDFLHKKIFHRKMMSNL
mgnify:CR=1 FL=1